ncbi:MAG TPA: winged helix-turn-helix transcriptional regulator [Thermoleophilaceae bacterium]|nr:winged helix-turn-helix transcriptional regulator [Thermoleophilaceae bacterium]
MAGKRTYGEACGIPRALDRVGERWALMIVRELLLGPKRFTDLRTGLPNVSPDVLAQRLRELDESGVVQRRKLPPPAASQVYELTEWGFELEPVVLALGRWGARAPEPPDNAGMSFDAHILSLMTLFDPELAEGFDASLELRLEEHRFRAEVADGELEVVRGDAIAPDVTIETGPGTLIALVHGHRQLAEALSAGDIEIAGDEQVAERFLGLFPLPEPAMSAA